METIGERIQANVYFKNKIALVLAHLLLSHGNCNLDISSPRFLFLLCNFAAHLKHLNMSFDLLTIAKNYLKALKQGKTGKELAIFFHEDVVQVEMPNQLNPHGNTSDLTTLLERAEQGKKLLKSQDYQIRNAFVHDNTVILELDWSGIMN